MQTQTVKIGTEFPAGVVVKIQANGISLKTPKGVQLFSLSQIESFVDEQRSVSQTQRT